MPKLKSTRTAKAKAERIQSDRLPNAPLIEVVFELRWNIPGDPSVPPPFRSDPGYYVFADKLAQSLARKGYPHQVIISSMAAPGTIERRFYKSKDRLFPLVQTGPGIIAVNDSVAYQWSNYRGLCLFAIEELLNCYPELTTYRLEPNYIELRYVDSFNKEPSAAKHLARFLEEDTTIKLSVPRFVPKHLGEIDAGSVVLQYSAKSLKDTIFHVTIGNGETSGIKCITMNSRVITKADKLPLPDGKVAKVAFFQSWLEAAHEISSPFFRELVRSHLMDSFKVANDNATRS